MTLTIKQKAIVQFLTDKPGYKKRSPHSIPCAGSLQDKQVALKFSRGTAVLVKSNTKTIVQPKVIKGKITPANLNTVKNLEQRNKLFNAMSIDNKKMAVAYDVLAAIKLGIIVPTHDTYTDITNREVKGSNPQLILCDLNTTCDCCGIGAIFVSKVRLGNNAKDAEPGSYGIHENLKGIFSTTELDTIERNFEGWDGHRDIFNKYNNAEDRMKAIMRNIIKNKGTFKP